MNFRFTLIIFNFQLLAEEIKTMQEPSTAAEEHRINALGELVRK